MEEIDEGPSAAVRADHSVLALRYWEQAPDLRNSPLDFL